MQNELLLGVDEAGRGPLAGPVAVGVIAIPPGFDILTEFPGVTDSKLLSGQKRERLFEEIEHRAAAGDINYSIQFSSHAYIDRFGITRAVRKALWAGVRKLSEPEDSIVMLDGLLRAPKEYEQRTVIGGDLKVPLVSLASIVAKVMRDRLMEDLSDRYPEYGFEQHKGYGTREHQEAIRRNGLCEIHRITYCKQIVNNSLDVQSEQVV